MMNYAVYFAGDGYSTERKIMGRQSTGQSLVRGWARRHPDGPITALTVEHDGAQAMLAQLQRSGFRGEVRWSRVPALSAPVESGALYYPGPPSKELAHARNRLNPSGFSLMGVTHTMSSLTALDQIADMAMPPFQDWDACICTSQVAQVHVRRLLEETQSYWIEQTGARTLPRVQTPLIPLGINVDDFDPGPDPSAGKSQARQSLGIQEDEVVVLFAGRLSFHAKAHPAPVYQALQSVAAGHALVCVEAGVFGNDETRHVYEAARATLAPSVRFITVNGADEATYRQAWKAADIFASLSDNIQETFGLTPVEAMAAGLAVLVSDWNGYKDTVRHEVDGLRVPTVMPPAVAGDDLTTRLALHADQYDLHVGRSSLATVVDPHGLRQALGALVAHPELRARLAASAQKRARQEYDWSAVLPRYEALAEELTAIRRAEPDIKPVHWPARQGPFESFGHFASHTLRGDWRVHSHPDALQRLNQLQGLSMTTYADRVESRAAELRSSLLECSVQRPFITVNALLEVANAAHPAGIRALMWLWKFDVLRLGP